MPQATKAAPVSATQMTTGEARASYTYVWEPSSFAGQEPKYQLALLIPKSDRVTLAKIQKCIDAAILEGKEKTWKGKIPAGLDLPLHDGDDDFAKDKKGEEYKGHFYLSAKSTAKPVILDEAGNEMLIQSGFYAGCYCKAAINFFAYDNRGKGVAVGLNGLKKTRDGQPFSGRPSVEQVTKMFEDDDSLV